MAFGRSSFLAGGGAGRADVEFRANIGKFRADVSEARQLYQRSTAQMSDAALRMAVAQEKLDRAIHRYGAESRQAKEATLRYRAEMRSLEGQVDRTGREVEQTRRTMERGFRGALAGTGIFRGLRGAIAFASGAFIGSAGLVYAVRSFINAAKEAQVVGSQLEAALRAQGIEYQSNRRQIEETIRAQSKLSAFDDEDLTRSFITLVRRTGDVNDALRLNAIAADVARGRNISLESAMTLVLKASLGQVGALRRVGIEAQKNADATELLGLLQQKYAGSAKAYGEDAAGAQERWNVALENAQEIVGTALLPTLTDLFNRGAEWLDQLADSGELQRKVNEIVETGAEVARGLAAAIKLIGEATEPVIDALGGLEKAVELALIAGLVLKVKRAAASFGLIALASRATTASVVRDAAVAEAALDVAYRPRVMPVTVVQRIGQYGAPIPAGRGGRGGNFRGALPILGTNLAIVTIGSVLSSGGGGTHRGDRSDRYPLVYDAVARAANRAATPEELAILKEELGQYSLANAPDANMARAERRLRRLRARQNAAPDREDRAARARGGDGTGRPRPIEEIELDIARAQARGSGTEEARLLRELRARYERQIRALENRKNLTASQRERLRQLYGELASVQGQLDSLAAEGERAAEERRKQAAERRQRRAERVRERLEDREQGLENRRRRAELTKRLLDDIQTQRALIAFYRQQAQNDALTRRERREYVAKRLAAEKELKDLEERAIEQALEDDKLTRAERRRLRRLGGPSLVREAERRARREREKERDDEERLTPAQVRAMNVEFLSSLRGIQNQFGGNLFPPWAFEGMSQTATHTYALVSLMREQNRRLAELTSAVRHPGARYARNELTAAFDGVAAF